MIIAIDGPAAAGKGTLAKRLAAHFHYAHLDTGGIYRATGKKALDAAINLENHAASAAIAASLTPADLVAAGLRSEEVGHAASVVSAIPEVRAALLDFQRDFAANPPGHAKGAVLDGRDVGTVVCPDADVKLYVTASDEVRAHRRHKELQERGLNAIYARVLDELRDRDARDTNRAVAPLKPADDAVVIDTSDLDADAAFDKALAAVTAATA